MPADFTNRQDRVKGHGAWYKHASDKQDTELLAYSFARNSPLKSGKFV